VLRWQQRFTEARLQASEQLAVDKCALQVLTAMRWFRFVSFRNHVLVVLFFYFGASSRPVSKLLLLAAAALKTK
jgi:hypothetical protein